MPSTKKIVKQARIVAFVMLSDNRQGYRNINGSVKRISWRSNSKNGIGQRIENTIENNIAKSSITSLLYLGVMVVGLAACTSSLPNNPSDLIPSPCACQGKPAIPNHATTRVSS